MIRSILNPSFLGYSRAGCIYRERVIIITLVLRQICTLISQKTTFISSSNFSALQQKALELLVGGFVLGLG